MSLNHVLSPRPEHGWAGAILYLLSVRGGQGKKTYVEFFFFNSSPIIIILEQNHL